MRPRIREQRTIVVFVVEVTCVMQRIDDALQHDADVYALLAELEPLDLHVHPRERASVSLTAATLCFAWLTVAHRT